MAPASAPAPPPLLLLPLALAALLATGGVPPALALSGCGGPCQTLNDCSGVLICINGKCNDDPDVGSHVCSPPLGNPQPPPKTSPSPPRGPPSPPVKSPPPVRSPPPSPPPTSKPPPPSTCLPYGYLTAPSNQGQCTPGDQCCVPEQQYPMYLCSPPVTASTAATLTLNDFTAGGDGGGPSECDNSYHSNSELVVALSTGWYSGGSRCGKYVNIKASNGKTAKAKVVDECDSRAGCDAEHAYLPPCDTTIVDASAAVWQQLGIPQTSSDYGYMSITWSDT